MKVLVNFVLQQRISVWMCKLTCRLARLDSVKITIYW